MKKHGFTLIEILIVVAIIGILATMGLIAFRTSLMRSRDARRLAEVKALQEAAEQYYADNNYTYPDSTNCNDVGAYVSGFGGLITGPQGESYICDFNGTATPPDYCICADLEDTNAGNATAGNCATIGVAGGFYCVENLF